jgi:two-component system cell cycle response regulator DivK
MAVAARRHAKAQHLRARKSASSNDPLRTGASSCYAEIVKRIALVEDNDDNRALIAAILDDAQGFELREYIDGPSALEGMSRERPDLVLLDVSLPGMDGTEVLERIRAHEALRALPVVVLTAHAMRGDRERFLALGFDAYIGKPIVDGDELVQTIARLLGAAAP